MCVNSRSGPYLGVVVVCFALCGWLTGPAFAADTEADGAARRAYWEAQGRYQEKPKDERAGWEYARACFDVAEFATNSTERALFAEQGIAAARGVLASNRESVAAHYYLGMNLGQLARTRGLGALKLVDQMETEFATAARLDNRFDYAGPDRNLGMLYLDAPVIASVGSRSKAKQHLQKAVALAPDYPENRLALIEACLKWHDQNGALREMKELEEVWSDARKKLAGPEWASSWADWESRMDKARAKLERPSKSVESPRSRD